MAYTTIDDPTIYFNTVLFTGTASGNKAVTGVGFQPDWVWTKNRVDAYGHNLYDSVRGVGKYLNSNESAAESTSATSMVSFDSDGFTVGTGDNVQYSSNNGVSWNWKAGGSASSNSNGSITSSVSANTTAGFSIVSYTGNGTDGATVGHGLTSPKLVLIKDRDNDTPWLMYGFPNHPTFTTDGDLIKLNLTDALVSNDSTTELSIGSSTVTFVDAGSAINASSTDFIMYCFQEIKGYSKFGSFTGNGNADGTFVYLGFKPAFVIAKLSSGSGQDWQITDNKRNSFNTVDKLLYANGSNAEVTSGSHPIDYLSNGFKCRGTGDGNNGSGKTYIYMAFAEAPFVTSTGIPTTAR